jgi:hypothetical protein
MLTVITAATSEAASFSLPAGNGNVSLIRVQKLFWAIASAGTASPIAVV